MRLSTSPLIALGLCALALTLASPAGARAKHHVRHPAKAATTATADATPAADAPVKTSNSDGSLHVPDLGDAPADDYARVAWCHGILTGDMELAEQISSLEPVDDGIQTIGRSYLRAYEAALTLSGKGATPEGHAAAETARQRGYDGWAGARSAEIHKAAYAYDTWQLPGECEKAAIRLSGHPNLFAELATDDEAKAIDAALNSGGPHNYDELPQPKLKAETVSQDSDAAISTNTLAKRAKQSADLPALKPDATPAPASSSAQPAAAPNGNP